MPNNTPDKKMMKVQLVRSQYGRLAKHQACVRGLGLRRMHQVVDVEDNVCTRGMVNAVSYMVKVVGEA
ncbi:50S ribosomal protein L30 [uncultured Thiodictyon sp.]|uniref:50S ribosomal protein L30 n=1 Tax=uncultured Thiodictyon sp. TaxID=1846217 RepID=UPI0025F9E958|nr:50S ribosomal protein L30 [uncultured Thiodictyon sp.]